MRTQKAQQAVPAANGSAVLHDELQAALTTTSPGVVNAERIKVFAYVDQPCTLIHEVAAHGSTNLRVVNGGGAGETIAASTIYTRTLDRQPGRNRVSIKVGATPPTVWEVSCDVSDLVQS